MPEISMCLNEKCPLKEKCYRYTAKPSFVQTYAEFEYKDGKCEYFWDNKKKKK